MQAMMFRGALGQSCALDLPFSYFLFAKEKNEECLSKSYENAPAALRWVRHKGHSWSVPWVRIQSGAWRPTRAGHFTVTKKRLISQAFKFGITMTAIADKYGVNRNTVSKVLQLRH